MKTKQEIEYLEMIAEDIAKFTHDPISYVLWAFPWGTGALRGFNGPRKWQEEYLGELGDLTKSRNFNGIDPVAPIQLSRASGHGIGKALRCTDYVPTPTGPKLVIEVKKGDLLFNDKGEKVLVKSTKSYKDCPFMKVTFSDRSSVEVSTGHLWKVKGRQERRKGLDAWRVLSTQDIFEIGVTRPNGVAHAAQWEIPRNKCVDYPKKHFNVDPYIYGVCAKYSSQVDRRYIESSDRLFVLQGLLDADGWVGKRGGAAFSSASRQLTRDVIEIARSLGLIAREEKYKPNDKAGSWSTYITWDGVTKLFRIERKQRALVRPSQDRFLKRWITDITPVESSIGICFEVEGELFLTKDYHVTHNSALSAWLIKWISDTRPYSKGVVTANTSDQLRTKTWGELGRWHHISLTSSLFDYHATKGNMNLVNKDVPEQWRCDAMTSREENSEAFAGLHAASSTPYYLFDEASAIPERIYEVAQGGLTDGEPMFFLFGNPTRNTGFFRRTFGNLKHRWSTKQIDSREVEGTNKDLMNKWIEDYGDDSDFVRVRVKGQFPRSSVIQLIGADIVENAFKQKLHATKYEFAPKIIGVDVAWYGDDRNVIFLRQGLSAFQLWEGREVDSIDIAGLVAQYEDEYETDATFIDAGMGNGVIDNLRRLDREPIPVYFGGRSISPKYLNKRSEMWGLMKDWLKYDLPMLHKDNELLEDLTSPEYHMTLKGQIQLESKESMKKRGLASPDKGDALALTFAAPVYKKIVTRYDGAAPADKAETDYDLFA